MTIKINDSVVWEETKKTIRPLKGDGVKNPLPPRLHVYRTRTDELIHTLDLHGFTVQEAYDTFVRFLNTHAGQGSRRIQIITGMGRAGSGLIYNEMNGWLKTPKIADKIRTFKWTNGGGCVEIMLKKGKK